MLTRPLSDAPDFDQLRRNMVDNQLRTFSVTDHAVLAAMLAVRREDFTPADRRAICYSDAPIRVRGDALMRTMLQPMVLARMIQNAAIQRGDRVLDVAGACGYSAAVLAQLAGEVIALESDEALAREAGANLARAGLANARAVCGPLDLGFAAAAPYDVILVNGMIERDPDVLLSQLGPRGRLLAIRRLPGDPTGRAGKVVAFENFGESPGVRTVFDASAPILPEFRREAAFSF